MAEPFETLREVGVALDGFRTDVSGQFNTLKWIIGGVSAAGLAAAFVMYGKIDTLEETAARNTAILERIETRINSVSLDTGAIRESMKTASATPDAGSFSGYVGVKAQSKTYADLVKEAIDASNSSEVWVYFPENK